MPALLENDDTNYISMNFSNGLLYCCLSEAYGYLKESMDMLTLYEQKYKTEVQKFASEQIGREDEEMTIQMEHSYSINSPSRRRKIMAITFSDLGIELINKNFYMGNKFTPNGTNFRKSIA